MNTVGNGVPGLGAAEDAFRQTQSYAGVMDGSSSSKVTGALFETPRKERM